MIFPNKLFTYKESVISKFSFTLQLLQQEPQSVSDLYKLLINQLNDINEFLDLLDCLYALEMINFDEKTEVIYFVKRNCM